MWYLIAGKLMSVLIFMILFESLNNFTDLVLFERSIGWFLIEHLFEEYNLTAGKFFLINEDFRTLIRNSVLLTRNIIFLAQILTPLEFFIINLLLISTFIFYKKKNLKDIVRIFIIISYFFLFQSFLFFNFFFMYLFLINFLLIFLIIIALVFYLHFLYLNVNLNIKMFKNSIKIIFIKLIFYFFLISVNFFFCLLILVSMFKTQENIIQELGLNILIPYSYFYLKYV